MVVVTVGYQGSTWEDFVARLTRCRVRVLADIRRHNDYPLGDNPWRRANLAPNLERAGICYVELRELAPSQELLLVHKYGQVTVGSCDCRSVKQCVRDRVHERRALSTDEFRTRYLRELDERGGLETLRRFLGERASTRVALMCVESDPAHCHRTMLAEAFLAAYPSMARFEEG